MISLKPWLLVVFLITSATVSSVGTKIILNLQTPEPMSIACEPAPGKNTLRHVSPINTGRDKGY